MTEFGIISFVLIATFTLFGDIVLEVVSNVFEIINSEED